MSLPAASRVLAGVRIIDFTQAELGPAGTQMLADFGADVIKIERPGAGDLSRWSLPDDPAGGDNPVFASMNRNKRSVTLDLRTDQGKEIARRLILDSDVVVNNFRPHVMSNLGLGYEELSAEKPELIYAYASGFGATGPMSTRPGQDILAQALSGVMLRKTDPNDRTTYYATCLADYTGAMHLAQGILLALLHVRATGRGQFVEVSLLNSMLAMQLQEATMHLQRQAELNWGAGPITGVYETTDKPFVVVAAFRREPLRDICHAIGIEDLSQDPRFATLELLRANRIELRDELQKVFRTAGRDHWLAKLADGDILCAPIMSLDEALTLDQVVHNQMIWKSARGRSQELGNPVRLSESPAEAYREPPRLGEHTETILAEFGYSAQQIDELKEAGCFG